MHIQNNPEASILPYLPAELLVKIFAFLDLEDMQRATRVCVLFKQIIDSSSELWRGLAIKHGMNPSRGRIKVIESLKFIKDLKTGIKKIKCEDTIVAHKQKISELFCNATGLFSASWDGDLGVWNKKGQDWSGELIQDVFKNISSMCYEEDTLFIGSFDGNAYVVNIQGFKEWRILTKLSPFIATESVDLDSVHTIFYDKGALYCGSYLGLKGYENQNNEWKETTYHEFEEVITYGYNGKKLFCGHEKGHISIWEMKEKKWAPIENLQAHNKSVTALHFSEDMFFSLSEDSSIKCWGKNEGRWGCYNTLKLLDSPTNIWYLPGLLFITSDANNHDSAVLVYAKNSAGWEHLFDLKGHHSKVTCLSFFNGKIFTGSEDGEIKVWGLGESSANKRQKTSNNNNN